MRETKLCFDTPSSDVSEVKEKVIEIAVEMEVEDVFIRPLATR